jgi:photosystem II stability/assembly factor-like uncharacterized protein
MGKAAAPFLGYRLSLLAALLGLAGIIGAASSMSAFSADAPGRGPWTWQNPLPNGNDLGATCASQTLCYVTGIPGGMLVTSDGGSTWWGKPLNIPVPSGSMSCPTLLVCYLGAGDQILHTSDGWHTWERQPSPITVSPPVIAFVGQLSCPTATTCFGIVPTGSMHPGPTYIIATTNSGATWVNQTPGGTGMIGGIACPDSTTCYATGAYGSVETTKDGGTTWLVQQPVQFDLGQVSCPSPTFCASVGWNHVITTVDGGLTWTTHVTPASLNSSLSGISCPTVSRCMATGSDNGSNTRMMIAVVSNDSGSTWQTVYPPTIPGWLGNVACPITDMCVAAGWHGWIAVTHDGGTTWSSPSSGISTPLNAVSCPDDQACVAAGDSGTVLATANAGRTWVARASGTTARLLAISCPDAAHCTAVGAGGTIIRTSDAGLHWAPLASNSTQDLLSISCPDTTRCVVVGQSRTVLVITTGAVPAIGPFTSDLQGVSCPGATSCYVVGWVNDYPKTNGSIDMSTDGGMHWTSQNSTDPVGIQAISCTAGTSSCAAVDRTGGMVSSTDGLTWSVHAVVRSGFTAVSCPASGACVALSPWDGIISTNDGGITSQIQPPVASRQLFGVSCPSVAVCTVVGDNGAILANRPRMVPSILPAAPGLPLRTYPPAPPQLSPPPSPRAPFAPSAGIANRPTGLAPAAASPSGFAPEPAWWFGILRFLFGLGVFGVLDAT